MWRDTVVVVDDAGDSLEVDASCVLFGFLLRGGSVFPRFFPSMQWLLMNLRNSGFGFSTSVDTTKCSPAVVAQEDKHVRNEASLNNNPGYSLSWRLGGSHDTRHVLEYVDEVRSVTTLRNCTALGR